MKPIARLGCISILALSAVACGGRGIYDFGDDETGTSVDSGGTLLDGDRDDTNVFGREDTSIWEEDAPWWEEDTGTTPVVDTGVGPSKDSGTLLKDTGVTPIKDSGVIGSDTGYVGTDTAVPPDSGVTMAATCAKIAKATCTSSFKTCCETRGFAYDYLACDDVSRQWCDDAADGVVAGRTTYNPGWGDACAAGWSANTTACQPHIFDWVKNQAACSQLFNGTVAVGGACSRQSDCRAGLGEVAYCDETAKRCRTITVVGSGQSCNYFGAAVRWCDRGLTCDTSVSRCITATPIGGGCFGADDTSCGIGNTCRGGKCAVGAAPGASCTRDLECGSWECDYGTCTDIRYMVPNKIFCSGI